MNTKIYDLKITSGLENNYLQLSIHDIVMSCNTWSGNENAQTISRTVTRRRERKEGVFTSINIHTLSSIAGMH